VYDVRPLEGGVLWELLEQIGGDIRFGGGPAKDVGEDDVIGFRVVGCRCSR